MYFSVPEAVVFFSLQTDVVVDLSDGQIILIYIYIYTHIHNYIYCRASHTGDACRGRGREERGGFHLNLRT